MPAIDEKAKIQNPDFIFHSDRLGSVSTLHAQNANATDWVIEWVNRDSCSQDCTRFYVSHNKIDMILDLIQSEGFHTATDNLNPVYPVDWQV